MAREEIADLGRLPHDTPAILLTSATVDSETGSVRGVREMSRPDPLLTEAGFFPQCLLVELMCQTAGLALPEGTGAALVAGIRGMHLHRAARSGERIEVDARLERQIGRLFIFECRSEAAGSLLAHGSVVLRAL